MRSITPVQWLQEVVKLCMGTLPIESKEIDYRFAELERVFDKLTNIERKYIHKLIREQFEVNDGLYILSFLVNYMKHKEFLQDVVYNLMRGEFDCFTRSMLEIQIQFEEENISYSQMRKIHRKSAECFEKELECNLPYISGENRNRKRIAIVTEQLLVGSKHAPTDVVLRFAYIFQKYLGFEVLIFVCTSNQFLPIFLWVNTKGYNGREKGNIQINYMDEKIDVCNFPMNGADCNDYVEMLTLLHQWNPLFVINMGVMNPIAELPQKFTMVVAMGMTIECPVSDAEVLIRYGLTSAEKEMEYQQELLEYQTQLFTEKMPVVVEMSGKKFTRVELGLSEESFLIAVVGNRLDKEVDEKFAEVMKRILRSVSKTEFVIIGDVEKIQRYFEEEIFQKRIHYLGFCSELYGTYCTIDLYLNPKRLGGGFSSAIALGAGVPVVTLPECDVAYNTGEDFVVHSEEEMVATVIRHATDSQYHKEKIKQAQKAAETNSIQKLVDYVGNLVERIQEIML